MIKCHIFSLAVPARENMWHFIMFREHIFHISRKRKNNLLKSDYRTKELLFHIYWYFRQLYCFVPVITDVALYHPHGRVICHYAKLFMLYLRRHFFIICKKAK
jgi:hypothetical protein